MTGIQIPHRVRFEVANVAASTELLTLRDLGSGLERASKIKIVSCPKKAQQVLEAVDFHPLIAAAALAFKKHYPLVISPDMIWLAVIQGVAQHINNNHDALRARLVHHQGKIELVIDPKLGQLPQNDQEMLCLASQFVEAMQRHILPDKHFLLRTEFTTTTNAERVACGVALMDAFQAYFDYVFYCICGIPSVILEGTTDDWERLKAEVEILHATDLGLSWWTEKLAPLCDHFIRASRGDIDVQHWRNLFKLIERYGFEDLNGWLLNFIPYVRREINERPIHRNPVLEQTAYPDRAEPMGKVIGCTSRMLPTGLSKAPVTCVFRGIGGKPDLHMELQFIAGFAGVTQDKEDFSLRPLIGWAIAEPATIDQCIKRLHLDHGARQPVSRDTEQIREVFSEYLPADLWRLYSEVDGAAIRSSENLVCRLLPLSEVRPACSLHDLLLDLANQYERQQIVDPEEYHRLRQWVAPRYAHLVRIAELSDGTSIVVGRDPESRPHLDGGRMEVFRWTGEAKIEAFDPVAPTITAWLEKVLRSELAPH